MSKLLTIAIPSFNREKKLENQINNLENQIIDYLNDIEVIVSNNCSTDGTEKMLEEKSNTLEWLIVNNNKKNLGLIGNIYKLQELSNSKYIWFIGDDDELISGSIEKILNILKENEDLNMIYINHKAYIGNIGNAVFEKSFSGECGLKEDGTKAFCEIFLESHTSLMFITACVYKRENITKYKKEYNSNNLEAPLFFTIRSFASGKVYITKEVMVFNKWGTTSWNSNAYLILYKGVFNILLNARDYGYSDIQTRKMIKSYLLVQQQAHFLSVFKTPYLFIKLIAYYDLSHIINMFKIIRRVSKKLLK